MPNTSDMRAPPPCGRCHSPIELGDLRCAVCGLPTPAELAAAVVTKIEFLRCEGCGAAVSYDVKAQAPKCSFCDSVMHVETPEDPVEEARASLPFAIDDEAAKVGLRAWLGTLGFFRPSDLQSAATIGELKPLWWVGWVFDAEVLVSWAADSEVGSRRSRWAPHAGQREVHFRKVLVPASRGLTSDECRAIADGYRLASQGPPPEPRPGVLVERFDVQRSAARAVIAEALERAAAGQAAEWVPGSRLRKLRIAVLPKRLTSDRLAFPAYVLAYRYRGKLYRAVVNGQNAGVVTGKAPYSLAKILLVSLGGIALIAII
ncbi:MAG: zinc ribbon domain-containing protein, partial [Myxococcales bacterium]|nr:zinc ribbon domain-containing protein [Myxococcales bacterium]